MNIQKIRKDFPILKTKINGNDLIYLDNANIENGCLQIIKKSHVDGIKNHNKNDKYIR